MGSHRLRRPVAPALALVLALLTAASAGSARASVFTYRVSGNFLTASGPGKLTGNGDSGFDGWIRWDTSLNGGNGGWSEWTITTFRNGLAGFTWSSLTTGAGCFSSPFTNFTSGTYAYSMTAPGSGDCLGGQVGGLASPYTSAPYTQSVSGQPDVINLYSPGSYTWDSGGAIQSQAQWFRIPVKAASDFATSGDLSFDPVKNNQQNYQSGWFAWNALITDADAGVAGIQGSCNGVSNGTSASTANVCPFMGGNSYRSGLSQPIYVVEIEPGPDPPPPPDPANIPDAVPGPPAIAGLLALWRASRRLRCRALRGCAPGMRLQPSRLRRIRVGGRACR